MKLVRWLAVIVALELCVGTVRAQCTGQYANDPIFETLPAPSAASRGYVTATLTITSNGADGNGPGVASHMLTQTLGTGYSLTWSTQNVPSGAYATFTTLPSNSSWGATLSGTWAIASTTNSGSETFIYKLFDSSGNLLTSDRITVTGQNGANGLILSQDRLDTNFYQAVTATGGGSSMLTSCQECQAGTTQHCINATHTPYSTISLTNDLSGESQLLNVQSGSVARSNETLSFSASLAISMLPGDTGTVSINHKIVCSMDGIIFEQQLPKPKTSPSGGSWNPSMTGELAFTKMSLKVPTHCTPKLNANGQTIGLICDVGYYCSARSSPPDYQPTKLVTYYYTNPASVPTYWMTMSPGTALVFGKNQPGEIAIWYFPVQTAQEVLVGMGLPDPLLLDIFSVAWVSDSSTQDCTKWISGITPWYMPKW